jgi:hypothetical protein
MYNTNEFRIETMYDYYIAMKFKSLAVVDGGLAGSFD